MSSLGLAIFDKAVQDANIWVNDVQAAVGWNDKQRAYRLMRETLHLLRDRLQVDECAQLAAQLPTLIRGIYYEGYNPSKIATDIKRKEQFVWAIEGKFQDDPLIDPEAEVSAVMDILAKHISRGEIEDVKKSLPEDLRKLWAM
ncbi:MAG: DUF2267 domain-containing protein [Sphingorhabdus sp.]